MKFLLYIGLMCLCDLFLVCSCYSAEKWFHLSGVLCEYACELESLLWMTVNCEWDLVFSVCVCVYVCVCEGERGREKQRERGKDGERERENLTATCGSAETFRGPACTTWSHFWMEEHAQVTFKTARLRTASYSYTNNRQTVRVKSTCPPIFNILTSMSCLRLSFHYIYVFT